MLTMTAREKTVLECPFVLLCLTGIEHQAYMYNLIKWVPSILYSLKVPTHWRTRGRGRKCDWSPPHGWKGVAKVPSRVAKMRGSAFKDDLYMGHYDRVLSKVPRHMINYENVIAHHGSPTMFLTWLSLLVPFQWKQVPLWSSLVYAPLHDSVPKGALSSRVTEMQCYKRFFSRWENTMKCPILL